MDIKALAKEAESYIIDRRRHFHKHPELSFKEWETTKTIVADCLNVRQSPSLYASIVSYYYYGAMVEVTETTDADGITWGKTSSGWISMDYAK